MKSKSNLEKNAFWKIKCLDCGSVSNLLTDSWKRIICMDCLTEHQFKEIENEIYSESYSEMESGHNILLQIADIPGSNDSCSGLQEFIENNGEV